MNEWKYLPCSGLEYHLCQTQPPKRKYMHTSISIITCVCLRGGARGIRPHFGLQRITIFGNFKYIKRTNALFSNLCFPSLEFQVRHVVFEGTNYYIFIFDTISSPKPCHCFLKGRFVCILQPKPRNSTFVIESGRVLS